MIKDTILNISKKLLNLDNKFLPHGTVITVELDGSGDFDNLQSALDSLIGKYSSGIVKIKLGDGTFTRANGERTIDLNTSLFNFSRLIIEGNGIDSTIIAKTTFNGMYESAITIYNFGTFVELKDLSIQAVQTNSSHVITYMTGATGQLSNVKLINGVEGLYAYSGSKVYLNNFTTSNCISGVFTHEAEVILISDTSYTCSNASYALNVREGGTIRVRGVTKYFTNVTKVSNQTIGTISTDGIIIGTFYN